MSQQDAAQKTHKPTPKRIREFRKRGEIAFSKDLVGTTVMIVGGNAIAMTAGSVGGRLADMMRQSMFVADGRDPSAILGVFTSTFLLSIAPVLVASLVALIVVGGVQLGWPPALKKPGFDIVKVVSFGGAKQIFAPKEATGRALKSLAKVGLVGVVVAVAVHGEFERYLDAPAIEPNAVVERMASAALRLGIYAGSVLLILALIDFGVQKHGINKKMMMSTEELKREGKEQEGDPHIRGARRRKMREIAGRRMVQEVQKADVVIVNPTHYSVALRYQADQGGAPRVVAKGKDVVAAKIREIARKAGVPILSRPPLTRLIYKLVPEGSEIPADLYKAVAEVLAYVYRLRRRTP